MGPESQRTPKPQVSCGGRAMIDTQVFSGSGRSRGSDFTLGKIQGAEVCGAGKSKHQMFLDFCLHDVYMAHLSL